MAKLSVLVALLAALVAVSAVSPRTTITTMVVEDDVRNPNPQSCEEQMREQDNFKMCLMFLRERSEGGRSSSYHRELAMVTEGRNPEEEERYLKDCCRQLEKVWEECRCDGLSMMMSRHQPRGQGLQEVQKMRHMVENLPTICDLSPMQCRIESAMF